MGYRTQPTWAFAQNGREGLQPAQPELTKWVVMTQPVMLELSAETERAAQAIHRLTDQLNEHGAVDVWLEEAAGWDWPSWAVSCRPFDHAIDG